MESYSKMITYHTRLVDKVIASGNVPNVSTNAADVFGRCKPGSSLFCCVLSWPRLTTYDITNTALR